MSKTGTPRGSTPRPSIKPPRPDRLLFDVWLLPAGATDAAGLADDQLEHHRVEVLNRDQLNAEKQAIIQGVTEGYKRAPLMVTNLWLWCALVRTGDVDCTFPDFTDRMAVYDKAEADGESEPDPTERDSTD